MRQYVERLSFESPRYQMVGSSQAMKKVVQLIEKVAPSDATVLAWMVSDERRRLLMRPPQPAS